MTLVVDAGVVVEALVGGGELAAWAESYLDEPELAGPEFVRAESCNILRRLEMRGRLSTTDAAIALTELLDLRMDLYSFLPFAQRVWALRRNITSYDAWYVALAETLGCPLITLDGRLARAPGPTCEIITHPSLLHR